jgi:hypothetical protein
MKAVNLIPARRIVARQRLRHVRRAIAACWSWTILIIGVCAAGQSVGPASFGGDSANLDSKLEKAARELEAGQQTLTTVREELSGLQATLRATRGIANQPDWSILLALLGKATGDDVMLRSLDLQPGDSLSSGKNDKPAAPPVAVKGGSPAASRPPAFVLNLTGLAQTQPAVTQFVLRLERLGIFSRVTLLDTSREPFRDGEATSFRLECLIGGSSPATAGITPGRDAR